MNTLQKKTKKLIVPVSEYIAKKELYKHISTKGFIAKDEIYRQVGMH